MGWTFFTTSLGPGDEVTEAMRDELFAAIEERFPYVDFAGGVDWAAEMADINAGPMSTLVATRWGGGGGTVHVERLHLLLARLGAHFLRDETETYPAFAASGTNSLLELAADDEGLSPGEWAALVSDTADGWLLAPYWSVVRAAVKRLVAVRRTTTGDTYLDRGERAPFSTFATAVADLFGASTTSASGSLQAYLIYQGPPNTIPGYHRFTVTATGSATVAVPTASARAWLWGSKGTLANAGILKIQAKIGSVSGDTLSHATAATKIEIVSPEAGAQTLLWQWLGYEDSAEFAPLEGAADGFCFYAPAGPGGGAYVGFAVIFDKA